MKKLLSIIILMGNILVCAAQIPSLYVNVSKSEALQAVQAYYPSSNNDYYVGIYTSKILPDTMSIIPTPPSGLAKINDRSGQIISLGDWIIAVDENPMKGSGHSLSYYCVNKRQPRFQPVSVFSVDSSFIRRASFSSAYSSNRYGTQATLKPQVSISGDSSSVASHTYVVMMNGVGFNVENYERYWNDCSYLYQVLRNKYGVPKANFSILISDGEITNPDMIKADGSGFASSSTDLDGDGVADYTLGALRSNLQTVLSNLSNTLTSNDHLFMFFTGCGGYDEVRGDSYIKFWKSDSLYSSELNTMLSAFNVKDINIVLGQNSSGGFISNLQQDGRVITAVCQQDSVSWSCPDIPYNEAVYHWTSAINEKDIWGTAIVADTNNDGVVAATESFNYAQANQGVGHSPLQQTPVTTLSSTLGFCSPGYRLMIRDNVADVGDEPNMTTTEYNNSPDISVLNVYQGGLEVYGTPVNYGGDYSWQNALIDVSIRNIGDKTFPGGTLYLRSLVLSDGYIHVVNMQTSPIKTELLPVLITKTIIPGDTAIIRVKWPIPTSISSHIEDIPNQRAEVNCILIALIDEFQNGSIFSDYTLSNAYDYARNSSSVASSDFKLYSRVAVGFAPAIHSINNNSLSGSSDVIVVLENPATGRERLVITSVFSIEPVYIQNIGKGETSVVLNKKFDKHGLYTVSLIDGNSVVDSRQFSIK